MDNSQSQLPDKRLETPERIWVVQFTDSGELLSAWCKDSTIITTQPGDFVAVRTHRKVEYVRADLLQQPTTSERCDVSVTGKHRIDPSYCKDCGKKFPCVFPTTGARRNVGLDTNFPLSETLRLAVEWLRHLHDDHNCDCTGWEQRSFVVEAAERYQRDIAATGADEGGQRYDACEQCCGHNSKFRDEQRRCWYNVNGAPCGHRCGWVTFGRVKIDREIETETFERAIPPANVAEVKAPPRCPRCGRRLRSEFDEDVGFWRECDNCDYREQVPSAPTAAPATSIETLAADNHPLDPSISKALNEDFGKLYEPIPTSEAAIEAARGYWPTIIDRADGVKGHYCIGRLIKVGEPFWEYWNSGSWCSAPTVYVGERLALEALTEIRSREPDAEEVERLQRLFNDSCDTEDRCRELLKSYDRSDSMGVVPLDEVISVALLEVCANTIKEAIEVTESYGDSIGNPSRNIVRALQSLLDKKEREDAKSSIQG